MKNTLIHIIYPQKNLQYTTQGPPDDNELFSYIFHNSLKYGKHKICILTTLSPPQDKKELKKFAK